MSLKSEKINKTFRLDPRLLHQAKKILGYRTYTEAIEKTLRRAINNKRHQIILDKFAGKLKSYRSFYE